MRVAFAALEMLHSPCQQLCRPIGKGWMPHGEMECVVLGEIHRTATALWSVINRTLKLGHSLAAFGKMPWNTIDSCRSAPAKLHPGSHTPWPFECLRSELLRPQTLVRLVQALHCSILRERGGNPLPLFGGFDEAMISWFSLKNTMKV